MTTDIEARHSSKSNEHLTPSMIVEPSRVALGGIDLDPASSAIANMRIGATHYFDAAVNGYQLAWAPPGGSSRVFLNPPGGKMDPTGRSLRKIPGKGEGYAYEDTGERCVLPAIASAKAWWFKLAAEYVAGRVKSAVFIGFSIEILQQTQVKPPKGLPTPFDFTMCVPSQRIAYVKSNGEIGDSPPHASVIVYLASGLEGNRDFREVFASIGRVGKFT